MNGLKKPHNSLRNHSVGTETHEHSLVCPSVWISDVQGTWHTHVRMHTHVQAYSRVYMHTRMCPHTAVSTSGTALVTSLLYFTAHFCETCGCPISLRTSAKRSSLGQLGDEQTGSRIA